MKVRLVIEGNVQGAGYRAMVKNVARRLRIKGLVRNLDDGNVEGFCECDEKILNKFIEIIDRKGDPKQPFSLNVEKINVYKEGDVNCVGLPEEFGLFETDYRIKIDPVHRDSLERSEIGILILSSMHHDLKEGQDDLKEGQDKMIGKQDETIAAIKGLDKKQDKMIEKQDEMNQDMNKSFGQLNETMNRGFTQVNDTLVGFRDETKTEFQTIKTDYGKISQDLGKAVDSINTIAKSIEKLAEAIAKK